MKMIVLWLLLVLLVAGCAVPDPGLGSISTDIYQVELTPQADREQPGDRPPGLTLGQPINLTDREGFDNQPAFLFDGSGILYSSGEGFDINVWVHTFEDGVRRQLTHSFEREYSPAPIPGLDAFSAVRVEEWGEQRLWSFDADGNGPELLCEWVDRVGYYTWVDTKLVALSILDEDEPSELRLADPTIGWVERDPTAIDIGRSIHFVPTRNSVSFLEHDRDGETISELDLLTRETRRIVNNPQGSLDHAWGPDGALFATTGSSILRFVPDTDTDWVEIANYEGQPFHKLSRLAISPGGDRLVFVAEPVPTPTENE